MYIHTRMHSFRRAPGLNKKEAAPHRGAGGGWGARPRPVGHLALRYNNP